MEAWWQMFFMTDSDLSHVYQCPKSKKVHGTFGIGWKYQGCIIINFQKKLLLFFISPKIARLIWWCWLTGLNVWINLFARFGFTEFSESINPKDKFWTLCDEILIPIKLSHWKITKLKAFYEYLSKSELFSFHWT